MAESLIYFQLDGYEPSPVSPVPLRFDTLDQPEEAVEEPVAPVADVPVKES